VKTVRLAAAACAFLVLASCGGNSPPSPASVSDAALPAAAGERSVVVPSAQSARFAERREVGGGLAITVSNPKSFIPSDLAYPRASRAVGFTVVIDNLGQSTYRATQVMIRVVAKGALADQIDDPAQGYTGSARMAGDVEPGKNLRLTMAYAVPAETVVMRVTVQPDATGAYAAVEFAGTV